ncbi:hypothetical protein KW791_02520 [Candidatus Parcubacteria bacterium]|nr:hypothetical protein [Candidatus Parcubacteria bacterium]
MSYHFRVVKKLALIPEVLSQGISILPLCVQKEKVYGSWSLVVSCRPGKGDAEEVLALDAIDAIIEKLKLMEVQHRSFTRNMWHLPGDQPDRIDRLVIPLFEIKRALGAFQASLSKPAHSVH